MDTNQQNSNNDILTRQWLTIGIAIFSIIGVVILGWVTIAIDKTIDTAKYVLGVLLPLIGTWMGTVIAFYYGKENFDAASKSMQNVIKQLTPDEKLKSIIASEKMIQFSDIKQFPNLTGVTLLKDIVDLMNQKLINRLPVFDTAQAQIITNCIHKSTFEKFIANYSLNPPATPKSIPTLTYGDLTSDLSFVKENLENSMQFIKPDATLLDAKNIMDKFPNCEDVFITEDGTSKTKVLGWITDDTILNNSKV